MKSNNKKTYGVCILGVLCILITLFIGRSFATLLDNDVRIKENSELIYYLNVSYDGVDKNGVSSSSTTVSQIESGVLYVLDKIPDGLEFTGFVTTSDGSIGAVRRSDGLGCLGKVIDDTNEDVVDTGVWNNTNTEYTYHGLHYNKENRTVSFKVKRLKAGCDLVVGIKTITPTVDDSNTPEIETRRDFYNFSTVREKELTVKSNMVHTYIGSDFTTLYNVNYEYTGVVPNNAPAVPLQTSYAAGTSVGVASPINIEGYTFSGWSSSNVTISNNSFKMPENDVTLKGSFTEISKNKVSYIINGTIPSGYVLPSEKEYYPGSIVPLDVLKEGNVYNGYRFLGWTTSDVTIVDNEFLMPNSNVVLTGSFEEVKYNVIYKFYDGTLPNNSNSLLPETKSYKPGVTVTLESDEIVASGYEFLGWYSDSEFVMPENDVTIYGEWKKLSGTFTPVLISSLYSEDKYYKAGEKITFKIKVKNEESYALSNVIIKKNNSRSTFESRKDYSIESDEYIKIPTISSNGSIDVYMTYTVTSEDNNEILNEVELTGAVGKANYELSSTEHKISSTAKVAPKLKICNAISGSNVGNVFQFNVINSIYETYINLNDSECETLYLNPGTYKVSEIIPQEYEIKRVEGSINANGVNLTIAEGTNYEITFTNEFKKKGFFHSFGRVVNQVIGGN